MTDFTTNSLLYPLSKGEASGHPFRGNQYKEVATETVGNTQRPEIGKFQLNSDEVAKIAKYLTDIHSAPYAEAQNGAAVMVSKMLGMDKPATRVDTPPSETPDLYRGCSKEGAESLIKPLEAYGRGGGQAFGSGVYTSSIELMASSYVDKQNSITPDSATMVQMWVDPNASTLTSDQFKAIPMGEKLSIPEAENAGLTDIQKENFYLFATLPANYALLHGYQMFYNPEWSETKVVLDRSVLKVAY